VTEGGPQPVGPIERELLLRRRHAIALAPARSQSESQLLDGGLLGGAALESALGGLECVAFVRIDEVEAVLVSASGDAGVAGFCEEGVVAEEQGDVDGEALGTVKA
jgi:hypothetical protein